MEYLVVHFVRPRRVKVDGNFVGKTKTLLKLDQGNHEITLGFPLNFKPKTITVELRKTTRSMPKEVKFEEVSKSDDEASYPTSSNEVVCFTAGFHGSSFAAGCIHAYLAADRAPPELVTGVSMGAVNAAAMEQAYSHLRSAEDKEREGARWGWYRNYLHHLTRDPLGPVWESLPSLVDFLSDRPPVRDLSTPKDLEVSAAESNRRRQLQIHAMQYFSRVRIRLDHVAALVTSYVRFREDYPESKLMRWRTFAGNAVRFVLYGARELALPKFLPAWLLEPAEEGQNSACGRGRFSWLCDFWKWLTTPRTLTPERKSESPFPTRVRASERWPSTIIGTLALVAGVTAWVWPAMPAPAWVAGTLLGVAAVVVVFRLMVDWRRPVLGWRLFAAAWALLLSIPSVAVGFAVIRLDLGEVAQRASWIAVFTGLSTWAFVAVAFAALSWNRRFQAALLSHVLGRIGVQRSLILDHHVRQRLREIFQWPDGMKRPTVQLDHDGRAPRLLAVVTALQARSRDKDTVSGAQVEGKTWRWWRNGTDLIHALRSAIALPPILEPVKDGDLDLIDASVLRRNPLPALFAYLARNRALGRKLSLDVSASPTEPNPKPAIIVVHNVPIKIPPLPNDANATNYRYDERHTNIVDVVTKGWWLSARRDTQDEAKQTQLIGRLEEFIWTATGIPAPDQIETLPIVTTEVAPDHDLSENVRNPLDPPTSALLKSASAGCRKTLETLYSDEIQALATDRRKSVNCRTLLKSVAVRRRAALENASVPGLPEVCLHCSSTLTPVEKSQASRASPLDPATHPHLTDGQPRIVIANSGGVFRGPFQVGMNAALLAARCKPDLIVGASVGTLLGGALASAFKTLRHAEGNSNQVLIASAGRPLPDPTSAHIHQLVRRFLRVDRSVALTLRLKGAFRDLGLRARAIRLSARTVRRLVKAGSRSDPGFASTGAPPALIDAISDLFLIPIRETSLVAAHFVSGHVAKALHYFAVLVKRDALRRLDVEEEVMDTSLLEHTAGEILDIKTTETSRQPFSQAGISFLATSTNLGSEEAVLLGGGDSAPGAERFDFLQACLASSAFPGVFRSRRESEVYPGFGDPSVRFSDGGLFDNLPILPALRALSRMQRKAAPSRSLDDAMVALQERNRQPDLFLIGALHPDPRAEAFKPPRDFFAIRRRASRLKQNMKIEGFQNSTTKVHTQVARLLVQWPADPTKLPAKTRKWLEDRTERIEELVQAAILPVYPTSRDHLNGTFVFCRSLGLKDRQIRKSVGDGCFRTLAAISGRDKEGRELDRKRSLAGKSLHGLRQCGKIPMVRVKRKATSPSPECPFFNVQEGPHAATAFICPFAAENTHDVGRVRTECVRDKSHQDWQSRATTLSRSSGQGF